MYQALLLCTKIYQCLRSPVSEVPGVRPGGMSVEGVDCVRLTLFKGQSTPFFTLNTLRYPEYSTSWAKRLNFTLRTSVAKDLKNSSKLFGNSKACGGRSGRWA